jgi:outer membrane lipoprotein carrier protein
MNSPNCVWLAGLALLSAGIFSPLAQAAGAPKAAAPARGAPSAPSASAPDAAAAAPVPDLPVEAIVTRVQSFYDGAKSFQADFTQRYTIFAYDKQKESRGRVAFVKPGKMSFRYESNGNRVVSDGQQLKIYEAENKQLFEQAVNQSAYPAALSFLLGEGQLARSFDLKKLSAETLNFKGGYVLLALPREASATYQKMLLYVDAKTFQVRRVLMIDAQKNKNVFDFSRPVVNRPVPADEFRFTPPPGTQIVKS